MDGSRRTRRLDASSGKAVAVPANPATHILDVGERLRRHRTFVVAGRSGTNRAQSGDNIVSSADELQ
jgi:hypothetical protein